MLRIAILENDIYDLHLLYTWLEEFLNKHFVQYVIYDNLRSNSNLLSFKDCDLIFLETKLAQMDGFELVREIRKQNNDVCIFFVTNDRQRVEEGFRVNAFRYLFKPLQKEQFFKDLSTMFYEYYYLHMGFYDRRVSFRRVYYSEIQYIEYLSRHSVLHLKKKHERLKYVSTYPLKHWVKELNSKFFVQTYRCFIVNLNWVQTYDAKGREIIMKSQDRIFVSKKYKKEFEEAYRKRLSM